MTVIAWARVLFSKGRKHPFVVAAHQAEGVDRGDGALAQYPPGTSLKSSRGGQHCLAAAASVLSTSRARQIMAAICALVTSPSGVNVDPSPVPCTSPSRAAVSISAYAQYDVVDVAERARLTVAAAAGQARQFVGQPSPAPGRRRTRPARLLE